MPHNVASDLALHCLPVTLLQEWVDNTDPDGTTISSGFTQFSYISLPLSAVSRWLLPNTYISLLRPEFFYFLVLGSADPNFWKSRIKIKLGSKSFIFILSADRLMPSTNEIKAQSIF